METFKYFILSIRLFSICILIFSCENREVKKINENNNIILKTDSTYINKLLSFDNSNKKDYKIYFCNPNSDSIRYEFKNKDITFTYNCNDTISNREYYLNGVKLKKVIPIWNEMKYSANFQHSVCPSFDSPILYEDINNKKLCLIFDNRLATGKMVDYNIFAIIKNDTIYELFYNFQKWENLSNEN